MFVGELIKKYRQDHSLSMQDFANITGLSKAYIGMLEKIYNPSNNQPISPSLDKLNLIARGMNMSLDELLSIVDGSQPVVTNNIKGHYSDPIAAEYAEYLRTRPEGRVLFDASKDLTKEEMQETVNFIDYLKSKRK